MVQNQHRLDGKRDQWFLVQNRTESFTMSTFRQGDEIVVCGACGKVWFADTWAVRNCCPDGGCKSQTTKPFKKKDFVLHQAKKIHIVEAPDQGVFVEKRKKPVKTTVSGSGRSAAGAVRQTRRRTTAAPWQVHLGKTQRWLYRALPKIRIALCAAAVGLSVAAYGFGLDGYADRDAGYYREKGLAVMQKTGVSVKDSAGKAAVSAAGSAGKLNASVTDTREKTGNLGVRIRQSVTDSIDKITDDPAGFLTDWQKD